MRSSLALWPERQIQIFQSSSGLGGLNLVIQLLGQYALLGQALQNAGAALVQLFEASQGFGQIPQLFVGQSAGGFFAIPGDKGHGRALIQQVCCGLNLADLDAEGVGDPLK